VRPKQLALDLEGRRARPGSFVAYAHERETLVTILLVGTPILTALLGMFGFAAAILGFVEAAFVTLLDVLDWRRAARDAWRMVRGEQPAESNVDYGVGEDCWTTVVPAEGPYREAERTVLLARGSPIAARDAIGRSLARRKRLFLLSACVCCFLVVCELSLTCRPHRGHEVGATKTSLRCIQTATEIYVNVHPGTCPTVDALRSEKILDSGFSEWDPWGSQFVIACNGDEFTVTSPGPDGKLGTDDDIIVPDSAPMAHGRNEEPGPDHQGGASHAAP
jgi:hypothetical protein